MEQFNHKLQAVEVKVLKLDLAKALQNASASTAQATSASA
jgi:hypothetical protein